MVRYTRGLWRQTMGKQSWVFVSLFLLCFLLVFSMVAGTLGSCDWPMFRGNTARNGYTISNTAAISAQPLWNFSMGASVVSSPAVVGDKVVFGSKDHYLYCLNAATGELSWCFQTRHEVNSSPAICEDKVYIGSYDGWVYCVNLSNGIPIWAVEIGGSILSSPIVFDDRLVIGSGLHDLYCFNASTGEILWAYPTEYRVQSSPAETDGVVFVACDDFHLYAINASTGELKWRTHTGSTKNSPAICDGYIYIGSYDGWLTCVNASTGKRTWTYQTGDTICSSAAVAYGRVFVGSEDGGIYCFDAFDGVKLWHTQTGYWVESSPAVANGNLFVGSQDYNLYCLDAYTGSVKWCYPTNRIIDSSPAIVNNTVYFGSSDYNLYALRLSASLPSETQNISPIFLSTIVFNILFCFVWITVIFIIFRYIYTSWKNRHTAQSIAKSSFCRSWFASPINFVCVVLILGFTAIYLLNINNPPLWAADEKTYSQISFHILKSGDYWSPWVIGEPAWWVGKPPLLMWLTSISYQVFGLTLFATRIWVVFFGFLSLIMIYLLGRKLYNNKVGIIAVFVLGSFVTFYDYATHLMMDVPLIFFILASIYYLILSKDNKNLTLKYAMLSGIFFGLALMTKQLEALLIPVILLTFLLFTKDIRFALTKQFGLFFGTAGMIFIPYIVFMSYLSKDFWDSFFVYSNFSRLITPLEGHGGNFLFYFQGLITYELFWAVILPFAVTFGIYNAFKKQSRADILVISWIVVVLGLFTVAQTKLFWYILPAMPAFALIIGNLLYNISGWVYYRITK